MRVKPKVELRVKLKKEEEEYVVKDYIFIIVELY
jgi:hypothetical protein